MGSTAVYHLFILIALISAMLLFIGRWRFSPFPVLLISAWLVALLAGVDIDQITPMITHGMGDMFGNVALIILLGTVLGKILEDSGGALLLGERLMNSVLGRFPSFALGFAGLIISIPVYCDSGFILLNNLRQTIAKRSNVPPNILSTSLAGGLYASSILVPPTPGPAAAAIILGLSPSVAILPGIVLAMLATLIAIFWAKIVDNKLGDFLSTLSVDKSVESQSRSGVGGSQVVIPIILPLLLMSLATSVPAPDAWIMALGQPANALFIGLLAAVPMWLYCQKPFTELLVDSFCRCAEIILIIAAGGALAEVLEQTGLIKSITHLIPYKVGLFLPFLIAMAFKISQGSSTVALISAVSLAEPLLASLGLDSETGRLLTLFCAASGAMVMAHANDSYFWVVTRFSGMDAAAGYRYFTMATLWQGGGCLLLVLAAGSVLG